MTTDRREVIDTKYVCVWLPRWLGNKESACNAGDIRDASSVPGLGRSPGGGNGNPLHILAWKILWTEEPGGLQSMGSQELDMT